MKELSLNDLNLLNVVSTGPMISIYISVESSIHDHKSIEKRYNDLVQQAEFLLLKDYPRSKVDACLEKLRDSTQFTNLLTTLDQGIVIFSSLEGFNGDVGFMKVQSQIKDLLVVADSYHIKPLLRVKNNTRGFFIVTMSSRAINVLIENQGQLVRMDSYRNEPGQLNRQKVNLEEFFIQSALELNKLFSAYQLPIVLAGVKNHVNHMRKHLNQKMLVSESVIANVEKMSAEELTGLVYKILAPYYAQIQYRAQADIDAAISNQSIITGLEEIAVAAIEGQIKTLFVLENKHIWGTLNKKNGEIKISPKQQNSHDDDLLDDLSQIVMGNGGEVVLVNESVMGKKGYALAIVSDKSHSNLENKSYTQKRVIESMTL